MPEFTGGLTPFLVAFDPDGKKTDQLMGKGGGGPGLGRGRGDPDPEVDEDDEPSAAPQVGRGGGGSDPGGYYEETIFGTHIWHSTNGQPDLHGQAAIDKADEVFGGPPTDGITGAKGYYGEWKPTGGPGYSNPVGGGSGVGRPGTGR